MASNFHYTDSSLQSDTASSLVVRHVLSGTNTLRLITVLIINIHSVCVASVSCLH